MIEFIKIYDPKCKYCKDSTNSYFNTCQRCLNLIEEWADMLHQDFKRFGRIDNNSIFLNSLQGKIRIGGIIDGKRRIKI